MKGYKIWCNDLQEYITAQEYAFKLGYKWVGVSSTIIQTFNSNGIDTKYKYALFLNSKGSKRLCYIDIDDRHFFNSDPNTEITLEELKKLSEEKEGSSTDIAWGTSEYKVSYTPLVEPDPEPTISLEEYNDTKRESFDKLLGYFGKAY